MSATELPVAALLTNPPTVKKTWIDGVGESITHEWMGERSDIDTKYQTEKTNAMAGNNVAQLDYAHTTGRATLVMRFGRDGNTIAGIPADVSVIEELYAVDVIKDISAAPYFAETVNAGKGLPLTEDAVAFVRNVSERNLTTVQITAYQVAEGLAAGTYAWANWSTGMKEYRYALRHGVSSYYETGFVLRRARQGVRRSVILASFTGINTVVAVPSFQSAMNSLILALPTGEWLLRPPQAEHLGRGKWRITEEWHWAHKWSIVYGGTWNL